MVLFGDLPPPPVEDWKLTDKEISIGNYIAEQYDKKSTFNLLDYHKLDGLGPDDVNSAPNWTSDIFLHNLDLKKLGMKSPKSRPRGGLEVEDFMLGTGLSCVLDKRHAVKVADRVRPILSSKLDLHYSGNGIVADGRINADLGHNANSGKVSIDPNNPKNGFFNAFLKFDFQGGPSGLPVGLKVIFKGYTDAGFSDVQNGLVSESYGASAEARAGVAINSDHHFFRRLLGDTEVNASYTIGRFFTSSGEAYEPGNYRKMNFDAKHPLRTRNGDLEIYAEGELITDKFFFDHSTGHAGVRYTPDVKGFLSNCYAGVETGIYPIFRNDGIIEGLVVVGYRPQR